MYIKPISHGATSVFDKNDCAVRALANASDMSYCEAHTKMKEVGRKQNSGTNQLQFGKVYSESGFDLFGVYGTTKSARFAKNTMLNFYSEVLRKSGTTLKNFIVNHQEGSFIVIIKGHALAVVDGELIDKFPIKENSRVCIVFQKSVL